MKHLVWMLLLASGLAFAGPQATLSWGAVTSYTDGSPISTPVTYTVYQGLQGAAKTVAQTGITATSLVVSSGLSGGTTVCWELTATAGGQESAHTAEACKTFPVQVPQTPSGFVVK